MKKHLIYRIQYKKNSTAAVVIPNRREGSTKDCQSIDCNEIIKFLAGLEMTRYFLHGVFCLILLWGWNVLPAQTEPGLFFMPEVFQAGAVQTASVNPRRVVLSMPSLGLSVANSAIPFQGLFVGPDAGQYDIGPLVDQLQDVNYARSWVDMQTFGLGIRIKNTQIALDHRIRQNLFLSYSDDIARLAWYGNGSLVGEPLQLSPDFQATLFHEIGARVSVPIGKRIRLGARLKYLGGLADANVGRNTLTFYTDPEYYQLSLDADYQVRTALPDLENLAEFNGDPSQLPLFGNSGLGLDLGLEASILKNLKVSANLLDLGSINWNTNTSSWLSQGNFEFNGLPMEAFSDSNGIQLPAFADSLQSTFLPSQSNETYRTNLPLRLLVGVQWDPVRFLRLGAMFEQEWYRNQQFTSLALHGGLHLKDWLYLGANYTYQPLYEPQVGAQLMLRLGPIQTYVMANQILTVNRYWDAKTANIRLGMNLTFGKVDYKKEKRKEKTPDKN
jgi:hypothetical protein